MSQKKVCQSIFEKRIPPIVKIVQIPILNDGYDVKIGHHPLFGTPDCRVASSNISAAGTAYIYQCCVFPS